MASDALKIARLQCSTQLTSQVLRITIDPLWSTILGFVVVHELRKRDLVGPVADDILYAGIIAVNTARTPGLEDLAGKGIDAGGMMGAAALGLVGGKALTGAGARAAAGVGAGAAAGAGTGAAAGAGALLPVAGIAALAAGSTFAGLKLTNPKNPTWKQILGTVLGGPITNIYRAAQRVEKAVKKK